MTNRNKLTGLIVNIFIGITILAMLVALNLGIDNLLEGKAGWILHLKNGILVVNSLVIAWIIVRLLEVVFWKSYEERHKSHHSVKLKTFLNFLIFLVAALYISQLLFDLPPWSLTTFSGVIIAGLGFALKGIILDFCSGILIDLEKPFTIDDWIHVPEIESEEEYMTGKVILKHWRTTTLQTHDGHYVVVPNSTLTKSSIINLDRPNKGHRQSLIVSLDYQIPVSRAERLLVSALLAIPEIKDKEKCYAWAVKTDAGGIDYCLRYTIEDYSDWRRIRHKVISSVTTVLNNYNLSLSESLGSYELGRIGPFKLEPELQFHKVAGHTDLFKKLSEPEISELGSKIHKRIYKKGDLIVKQNDPGDSLFLIGEGTVEVYQERKKGKEIIKDQLALLGPSQYFGDMALLLGEKRSATVQAFTDLVAFEVSKQALEPILKKRPSIVRELSRVVAEREKSTQDIIAKSKKKDSKESEKLYDRILDGIASYFNLDNF